MKLSKNDLKKLVQESVVKLMKEGLSDELYLENEMNTLAEMLTSTAEDFIRNLDDDRVSEDVKSEMLSNVGSIMQTAVDNCRRSATLGHY
jgi:hypothetical protein